MKPIVFAMILVGALGAAPALATGGDGHVEAYEACVVGAAVRASYTDAATDAVVDAARAACADTRARAMRAQPAMVAEADARRAATLPAAIDTLRDRRRTRDAMYGLTRLATR
ncbi:hypothetical protein [Sphingomonas sp.]|uniref:hypothetical protein n=1 Tax=Sphingomonas sp. TaxID=28214 RepID=UPI003B00FC47